MAWKTVRCIVDYRTPDDNYSERDLCRDVQDALDLHSRRFTHSKPWAKQFTQAIVRMEKARPKKLQAIIKAQAKLLDRLRKV